MRQIAAHVPKRYSGLSSFKGDKPTFFICLELALDTTKKWNLKHHLSDRLNAM